MVVGEVAGEHDTEDQLPSIAVQGVSPPLEEPPAEVHLPDAGSLRPAAGPFGRQPLGLDEDDAVVAVQDGVELGTVRAGKVGVRDSPP